MAQFKHGILLPLATSHSDWWCKLTVCIAASLRDEVIVTASDQRISMQGMVGGDTLMEKIDPIHKSWCAMVSGDDITSAIPIWDSIRKKLGFETGHESEPPEKTLEEVRDAVVSAYEEEREIEITKRFLKPHSLTHAEFLKSRKLLGDYVFSDVWAKIERFDMGRITLLVAGFDKFKRKHVFTVENPGVYKNYDPMNFWAIGSGQYLALTSMFLSKSWYGPASFETLIYEVCAAKFTAEAEGNVGKYTSLIVFQPGRLPEYYDEDSIAAIRQIWETSGKPSMHYLTPETIRKLPRHLVRDREQRATHAGPNQAG